MTYLGTLPCLSAGRRESGSATRTRRARVFSCLLLALGLPAAARGDFCLAHSDWSRPYTNDARTLALWHMDEEPGAIEVRDHSSLGHHGTLAALAGGQLDPFVTWMPGRPGFDNAAFTYWNNAEDFNRGVIRVEHPGGELSFGTGRNFTIEFAIKPTMNGTANGPYILQKHTGADWRIAQSADNTLHLSCYAAGGWRTIAGQGALATGVWTHVAVVFDRTSSAERDTVRIFMDGVLRDELTTGDWKFPPGTTNAVYMLGRHDAHPSYAFYGYLDEVRLSDTMRFTPKGNVVRNGSFEREGTGGVAEHWTHNGGAQAQALLDPDEKQEGTTSQRLEFHGASTVALAQTVTVPVAGDYYFTAWVKSDDRVIARAKGLQMPYVRQGEWQRLAGVVSAAAGETVELSFTLGGLLESRPTTLWVDDVAFYRMDPPPAPPRPAPGGGTPLVSSGAPAVRIVHPANSPEYLALALDIRDKILLLTGVEVPVADDLEATLEGPPVLREAFRDSHLILLGRLGINRALWPAYNRFLAAVDGYYPGGDGYVVRTAVNVLRNGRNHLIVGGSSDAGAARAVARFKELIAEAAGGGDLTLPWLLDVDLDGACRDAFLANDALWTHDPWNPALPPEEPGYGTVRRWYENAMAYYWSGWPGYRDRTLELIEPVIADQAYIHHYIAEFFVRAYRMLDQSGLFPAEKRDAVDGLIARAFWDWQEGERGWWRVFSPPYDAVTLVNRHQVAPWMGMLAMADFLRDTFAGGEELADLARYRGEELHGFFQHMVSERWGPSPPGVDITHFTEIANVFFRYALEHEVYTFFEAGHAARSIELESMSHRTALPADLRLPYAILAAYHRNGEYRWLLENLMFQDGHFMGRYVNGVRRYQPGDELPAAPPESLAGVHAAPFMAHWKTHIQALNRGLFELPEPLPAPLVPLVSFRGGFAPGDDYIALAGASSLPSGNRNPGALTHFTSRGMANWLRSTGDRYFDHNAVSVVPGDPFDIGEKSYAAAAALEWMEDFRHTGGVSLRLDPFLGTAWNRQVLWIESGLYAVRDTLEALHEDTYHLAVHWHPAGLCTWQDGALEALSAHGRLRITPLSADFWVSENTEDVAAGLDTAAHLQLKTSRDMAAGERVEAVTVLQAFTGSETRAGVLLLDTGAVRLQPASGPVHVAWQPLDAGGLTGDAEAFIARDNRLELFHFHRLELDGAILWDSAQPVSAVLDWSAGFFGVYAGEQAAADPAIEPGWNHYALDAALLAEAGRIVREHFIETFPGEPAGPADADGSGPLPVIDTAEEWFAAWSYEGLQRPARIAGVRRVDAETVDLGDVVLLDEIRNPGPSSGGWVPAPLPEDIWTATTLGTWTRLEAPPVWRRGVRTGNYGQGDPVEQSFQVVFPDVAARYVRAQGAPGLLYYDGNRLRGREPLRLEMADLTGDGTPEILAAADLYPYADRGRDRDASLAVLTPSGDERFQYDVPAGMMDVRLLDTSGNGRKEIVLVSHDARVTVRDGWGTLRKELDVYQLHEDFQETHREPGTRHPAGGYHTVYTLGLWRRHEDGRARLVLPRYGNYSFVDGEGHYEGVLKAGAYVQPAILPYGLDFSGDGIEEQIALESMRLIHLDGQPDPELRNEYWPEVYRAGGASGAWWTTTLPHNGGDSVLGSRVLELRALAWDGAPRHVLIAARDYLALYDARQRAWSFRWVPLARVTAVAVAADEPGRLALWLADENNTLWKLEWTAGMGPPSRVEYQALGDRIHRIRVTPGMEDYAVLCGNRGLYRLDNSGRLERLSSDPHTDARLWPDQDSVIAARADGTVLRLDLLPRTASGIPVAWLKRHGLPTDGSADFEPSPDGNPYLVWEQWRAGTNPNNPDDVLRVLRPPADGVPGFPVRWQSVTERTYRIERSVNLMDTPPFTTLQSDIRGKPGFTDFHDADATGPGPYFYRIVVEPP